MKPSCKIAAKVEDGEISQWNDTVDAKMEYAENQMEALEEWLERKRQEHQIEEQEKTMQFEIKLQETKLKLKEEHDLKCQHKSTPSEQLVSQAKLLKLVITKFNGSFTDWPRFWGQFSKQSIKAACRQSQSCLLYTSPSPRDLSTSRMPSSA